jgi:hypothetical protein
MRKHLENLTGCCQIQLLELASERLTSSGVELEQRKSNGNLASHDHCQSHMLGLYFKL